MPVFKNFRFLSLPIRKPHENLRNTHTPVLMLKLWPSHRREHAMHRYWDDGSILDLGRGSGVCRTLPGMLGLPAWLPQIKNLKWDIELRNESKKAPKYNITTLPPHPISFLCSKVKLIIILWYSHSVHPEKWHALNHVNACKNYIWEMASKACCKCLWELKSNHTVTTFTLFFKIYVILHYIMTQSLLWNDTVFITLDIVIMFIRKNGMHLMLLNAC